MTRSYAAAAAVAGRILIPSGPAPSRSPSTSIVAVRKLGDLREAADVEVSIASRQSPVDIEEKIAKQTVVVNRMVSEPGLRAEGVPRAARQAR